MEQDLSRALNIGDFGGFVLTAKLALSSFFTTPISVIAKHGMAERLWLDPAVFLLVGGLEHFIFSIQLGMSSSQVTKSIIFQRGGSTTNQIIINHH